jgi:hypothetical protein
VNGLLAQLLALSAALECGEGVAQEVLEEVRALLAACLVQQDPALLPFQPDPSFPPEINAAAQAGVALAAARSAAGVRLRFLRQPYLAPATDAALPMRIAGPFTDGDGTLVELRFFESLTMRSLRLNVAFVNAQQTLLRLPLDTLADAESKVFTIPAGTVWIGAHFLVFGSRGYVALRVDGGTLSFDHPARVVGPEGNLEIVDGVQWSLSLQPQASPAPDAEGRDGNALALQLPSRLVVHSSGGASVEGPIGIEGFGSVLSFPTPVAGAPVVTDRDIVFAYEIGSAAWSIDGNRSALLGLAGECTVQAVLWALPVTTLAPQDAGEAAHGGTVGVALEGPLRSTLQGGPGRLGWRDCKLLANAQGLDLRCRQGTASARLALSLWGTARTDIDLAPEPSDLRFVSRRDGAEMLSLSGGRLRNRWDLPRDAAGTPFGCDAAIDRLSLIVEAQGLHRIGLSASIALLARRHGLVLENAYLSVTPVRHLVLSSSGAAPETMASGLARLLFDVQLGEPMLPDPYAANWSAPAELRNVASALSVRLRWLAEAAPAVQVQLEHGIDYPEPRQAAAESDTRLGERFRAGLSAQPEVLGLLDLSTHDHHFGVALESLSDQTPVIDSANRLSVELRHVRLLMQPQVHWEPVQDMNSPTPGGTTLRSVSQGGHSLLGADSAERVPLLPHAVGRQIVAAADRGTHNAAALFSLPFGLRAYVHIDRSRKSPFLIRPVSTQMHEPVFDAGLSAAQQVRLRATGGVNPNRPPNPDRMMPGALHQTPNLAGGGSVLPADVVSMFNFEEQVPLHAVDLSGYGLSCFSHWSRKPTSHDDDAVGVTQVQFEVLIGRTAYELIEVRSVLAPCQARVVRTIVLERRNSGRVQRFDSGWQAVDDGLFSRYVPFDTGVLKALRKIRRIRELPLPALTLPDNSVWRPVLFDADAQIDDLIAGGANGTLPALDHAGYIQIKPGNPPEFPNAERLRDLFKAVGGTIGGAIDGRCRLGGTLEMHLHALQAALAMDDVGTIGFVVAAYGSPVLPRAGRWSAVRIDALSADVSPVDVHLGLPAVQRPGEVIKFVDPAQAHKAKPAAEYGLLVSTDSSRVLFPRPTVSTAPAQRGLLSCAPPLMADPAALVHASGQFPRSAFVLQGKLAPQFEISPANEWRLPSPDFPFTAPLPDLASGAGWSVQRLFDAPGGVLAPFTLQIDSVLADAPLQMRQPPLQLVLDIPGFVGSMLTMDASFEALSNTAAGLSKPAIVFGPALDELKSIVDSLGFFNQLPAGLVVQVDVDVDPGPNPGFRVHLNLKFSIGGGPEGRIDIGVGKFFGEFELDAHFAAALGGKTGGRLSLVFQGDVQQGILPPLLYAGGMFRFAIEVCDNGKPVIELGLGTVTSIGGDLIGGLLALEATVKYGYMLVPESLRPGVMLGIDARAQLLAGLFSMSFSADALARIERFNREDKTVTIFADIHVAGSVQVAVFFKESRSFQTQFEQRVPLGPLLLVAGANPLAAAVIPLVL